MTTKRFQYNVNKNCIECDGKFVAYLNSIDGCRIANKLTVLTEENEQLKSKNRGLQSELQIFKEDATHSNLQINKFADENEQLKNICKNLINEINKRGITVTMSDEYKELLE